MNLSTYTQEILGNDAGNPRFIEEVWAYQKQENAILRTFTTHFPTEMPTFLPIECFKTFPVKTREWTEEMRFESSGTTGQIPSRHYVKDLDLYKQVSIQGFFHFFPKKKYRILALLPSYLERKNASLVQMVRFWIEEFGLPNSGFYLHNFEELEKAIVEAEGEEIILIGVAFALLDFAEKMQRKLPKNTIVIETGGMKGRKRELTRPEMHQKLCEGFGIDKIASEYGMTELLSQAYALENGRFRTPPWMKVVISDIHLPTKVQSLGVAGRINVIDLANIHSCAFIATDDMGKLHEDGTFEVLGRIDNAELRGCNLMYL